MILYAVLHLPTNSLFPCMKTGSTHYDFYHPPKRSKHRVPPAPRLFESPRMAQRYITEYCKGIRNNDYFALGEAVHYDQPLTPRSAKEFRVVIINLEIKETINV